MTVEVDAIRTGNRERILVVDDSEANLLLLSSILQLDGYEIETVQSGPEALQEAWVRLPDLVLLDDLGRPNHLPDGPGRRPRPRGRLGGRWGRLHRQTLPPG